MTVAQGLTTGVPDGGTRAALQGVIVALEGVDHAARSRLDAAARLELVELAVRASSLTEGLRAVLIAEADEHSASLKAKGTPLTAVLAKGGVSPREAVGLVFDGRAAGSRERTRQAVLQGQVSVRQARSIGQVLGELPTELTADERLKAEQVLVTKAAHLSADRLKGLGRAVLEQVAPQVDAAEAEQRRLEAQEKRARSRRAFTMTPDGDGSLLVRGSLPALVGVPFAEMLQAHADRLKRAARDRRDRTDDALTATPEQLRADALIDLGRHWAKNLRLAGGESASLVKRAPRAEVETAPPPRRAQPPRPPVSRVVVTMSEESLRTRAEQAGLLNDQSRIGAGELRRLCCDAELVPVVLGSKSQVLDVGRGVRLVTPPLRQALTVRDGGCVFPGCEVAAYRCEAHHIVPWWSGGATDLSNLALLCKHHHGLVEPPRFWRGPPPDRWQVRLGFDGLPEVLPPARVDRAQAPQRNGRLRQ